MLQREKFIRFLSNVVALFRTGTDNVLSKQETVSVMMHTYRCELW